MSFLNRLFFNFRYLRRPGWDSGITPPEVFEFIRDHPAGRAIDLGCGTGTNVITLAEAGWQVTGMDFAIRAIQTARKKAKARGVRAVFQVGDVTRFPVRERFDLVLDIGCFHGVDDKPAYLDQLERLLQPGGSWLVYGFTKDDPALPGPGISPADLGLIAARGLVTISRRDGFDKKQRSSAWFLFQRK